MERDRRRGWGARLAAGLLALAGLGLALPGGWLVLLGGSPYYLLLGVVLLAAAWLALRRAEGAMLLFAAVLAATLAWSAWEAGWNGWALMPRLVFLFVAGCVVRLLLRASGGAPRALSAMLLVTLAAIVLPFAFPREAPVLPVASASPSASAGPADWAAVGNAGYDRFSPLAEITPANVGRLERAWTYHAGRRAPDGKRRGSLQFNPLMADGLVYGCTAFSTVFALDPVTGRQVWRRDTLARDSAGGHPVCRGLAFFRAPAGTAECPTRLLLGTVDNRLIALDARTGTPCTSFGRGGATDLLDGIGRFAQGWMHPTSPPTIVNGVAVIGHYIVDNQATAVPPGVIRGYDAVTGALRWAFDPGRPERRTPLGPGERYVAATPNSWTVFAGDPRLGLVYVPTGNSSPDLYGANRTPETERHSTALLALDAATGALRWRFQAVHHDLWDYDLAAQPVLADFPTGKGNVPALIVPTKSGQLFVLDRATGRPLLPVEERPVPASTLPDERPSATQPFSVGMPSFAGSVLTEADMWGLTPFDQLWCRIQFRRSDYRGIFTPAGLRPSLRYPGELGGIDWGSAALDRARGLLIVNANYMADRDQLVTRAQANAEGLRPRDDPRGHFAPGGAMAGTPYGVHWGPFLSGLGVPCQRPPYGVIAAVDLRTRRLAWSRPLGDARNSGPWGLALGLPIPLGAPNIGGSVATASGLVFIGATQDEMFRAIDVATGRVLWQTRLPASGHATPATYRARDGHQYVVIPAGGTALRDRGGDEVVAFRLGK